MMRPVIGASRHVARRVIARRAIDTAVLFAACVLVVWVGYQWAGGSRGYDTATRSAVFQTGGAWLLAECLLMFLRTQAELWDRFSWGLFVARLSIANYIGMQAIEMRGPVLHVWRLPIRIGGYAEFPDWLWSGSRTLFGLSAAFILAIVVREIVGSFRKAPRWRKQRAAVALVVVVVYVVALVTIW